MSGAASDALWSAGKLYLQRKDNRVVVVITCSDVYAAMELYDLAVRNAEKGVLSLNMITKDTEP